MLPLPLSHPAIAEWYFYRTTCRNTRYKFLNFSFRLLASLLRESGLRLRECRWMPWPRSYGYLGHLNPCHHPLHSVEPKTWSKISCHLTSSKLWQSLFNWAVLDVLYRHWQWSFLLSISTKRLQLLHKKKIHFLEGDTVYSKKTTKIGTKWQKL